MSFLLVFFFFTSNGGYLPFFFLGLRHWGGQIGPLTDIFDTFRGTSDITTVISAIHMHCYCKNDTGREGVNFIGEGGVKCVPRGVFLTVIGCG